MDIQVSDSKNKKPLFQCKIYQSVYADVVSTRYYGVPEDMAYDHEKTVTKVLGRKYIAG